VNLRLPVIWLALWFPFAIVAKLVSTEHTLTRSLGNASLAHPLGFDAFGRDLLLIVLGASTTSAAFALAATVVACTVALTAGTIIAMAPPTPRFMAVRLLEFMLAFPSLLFALAWAAIRGPGWDTLIVALLLGSVPPLTRLCQVRAHELLAEDFVIAAKSVGAGPGRIITHHLAPAIVSFCTVKAPNLFAHALLAEATLSFLGIGAPIGRDTWGSLLAQGKDYLLEAPHIAIGTGLPLLFTVLSLQLVSQTLSARHIR
jgi:peptide/nickel transport system permease protein